MDQALIDQFLGSFPVFFPIPPEQQDGGVGVGMMGSRPVPGQSQILLGGFIRNSRRIGAGIVPEPSQNAQSSRNVLLPRRQQQEVLIPSSNRFIMEQDVPKPLPGVHRDQHKSLFVCPGAAFPKYSPQEPLSLGMCSWTFPLHF